MWNEWLKTPRVGLFFPMLAKENLNIDAYLVGDFPLYFFPLGTMFLKWKLLGDFPIYFFPFTTMFLKWEHNCVPKMRADLIWYFFFFSFSSLCYKDKPWYLSNRTNIKHIHVAQVNVRRWRILVQRHVRWLFLFIYLQYWRLEQIHSMNTLMCLARRAMDTSL